MPDCNIIFARSARKELERLDPGVAKRIVARIETLGSTPRPEGCRKIQGEADLWRIRIGDYRVVYRVSDKAV